MLRAALFASNDNRDGYTESVSINWNVSLFEAEGRKLWRNWANLRPKSMLTRAKLPTDWQKSSDSINTIWRMKDLCDSKGKHYVFRRINGWWRRKRKGGIVAYQLFLLCRIACFLVCSGKPKIEATCWLDEQCGWTLFVSPFLLCSPLRSRPPFPFYGWLIDTDRELTRHCLPTIWYMAWWRGGLKDVE